MSVLHGLGTCDMKGGVAVMLKIAATVPAPNRDITFLFYESEEIEAEFNGLHLLSQSDPDLLQADFAILMEPSDAVIEAGCQGTLRVDVTAEASARTRRARGRASTRSTAPARSSTGSTPTRRGCP